MTPFDCYRDYAALKRHLTDWDYDYTRFGGKLRNVNAKSFENRRDKFWFERIARHGDPHGLMLYNLADDDSAWVGDLVRATETYLEHRGRVESLGYVFRTELGGLSEGIDSLRFTQGRHPEAARAYLGKRVSIESLATLLATTGCVNYWRANSTDPVIEVVTRRAAKYAKLIPIDLVRMRQVLVDAFNLVDEPVG